MNKRYYVARSKALVSKSTGRAMGISAQLFASQAEAESAMAAYRAVRDAERAGLEANPKDVEASQVGVWASLFGLTETQAAVLAGSRGTIEFEGLSASEPDEQGRVSHSIVGLTGLAITRKSASGVLTALGIA